MHWIDVLILSIVEGLTEFLPVSSTGHLILAGRLLGISPTEFSKSFDIVIQLGAILAVMFLYAKTLVKNRVLLLQIAVAFVPAAVAGFLFYSLIKEFFFEDEFITLWALAVGGLLLIGFERFFMRGEKFQEESGDLATSLSLPKAFFIGLFQALAIVPGVSRSAGAIVGGLLVGLSRKNAVEFSFLLAVPTILAASLFDFYKTRNLFTGDDYFMLILGFIGSFVTALFVIRGFLGYIKNHNFIPFGVYRIILAILFWLSLWGVNR